MSLRISVDTGGTCTDVVVTDHGGWMGIGKALTTPGRIFSGFAAALENAMAPRKQSFEDALADCEMLIYGTTHATNAALVGTTGRTALLVTEGFRDTLVLREGGRPNAFEFSRPYPEPYVPRHLTFEVPGRITAEGDELKPLDLEAVRRVARELAEAKIEAVAVCLLWSIADPAHELAVGGVLAEELPDVPVTLSHELNPVIREYRRASAAAIDASLKPVMQAHLRNLDSDLAAAGFSGELLIVTSLGGCMHLDDVVDRPLYLVKSGPSMAPVAATAYGRQERIEDDLLVCDTGGTSFDVSIVRNGRIAQTRETWLGEPIVGHLTGLSSVDVRSIGSGGGSIAWIDDGGLLRVGPESAGADPGPACYGAGGTQPTVTDAAAVLGYIDPDAFLGGRVRLDIDAARSALTPLATQLGLSLEEAAWAVIAVANEHMVSAISAITVDEGVDPREATIVAGGGAAGLNIVPIARELAARTILVPRTAGVLSACGGQFSDVVMEVSASAFATTAAFDTHAVNGALDTLDARLDEMERRLGERGLRSFERSYSVEARYLFQIWELDVELPCRRFGSDTDVARLTDAFHAAHEQVFAVNEPGQAVECLTWKARLRAPLGRGVQDGLAVGPAAVPEPRAIRPAYFSSLGVVPTPRYRGASLPPGARVPGPAVIEEPTTTIVVYPGSCALATAHDNYVIEIDPEESR